MSGTSKGFSLLLIVILAASSLIIFESANAQTPSTPIFSVNTANGFNVTPTTYSIDSYTGANITNLGYTIATFNVTLTIQNTQPTTAYLLEVKGHYSSNWYNPNIDDYNITAFASSGSQTVINLYGNNETASDSNQIFLNYDGHWGINVPFGGQLDFRLQSISGNIGARVFGGSIYVGNVSDWSAVQTVTVTNFSPSASASPNPTPDVPEFSWLIILILFAFTLFVALKFNGKSRKSKIGQVSFTNMLLSLQFGYQLRIIIRKKINVILILILLTSLSTICFNSAKGQIHDYWENQIEIQADGSVYPPIPLIQHSGNIYTLTEDSNRQITIKESNIVFDGNGHKIPYSLGIGGVTNVTIRNCFINTSSSCIGISYSSYITIINNTLFGGGSLLGQGSGVDISYSSSVAVIGNIIKNAQCGVDLVTTNNSVVVGNDIYAQTSMVWGHYPAAIMIDVGYGEGTPTFFGSSNNLIYDNIIEGTGNLTAIGESSSIRWDNGTLGNYWGNYIGFDANGDSIGDKPYVIDTNNIDHYPLVKPQIFAINNIITNPASDSTPTATSTVPEFSWLAILSLLASTLAAALFLKNHQVKKT